MNRWIYTLVRLVDIGDKGMSRAFITYVNFAPSATLRSRSHHLSMHWFILGWLWQHIYVGLYSLNLSKLWTVNTLWCFPVYWCALGNLSAVSLCPSASLRCLPVPQRLQLVPQHLQLRILTLVHNCLFSNYLLLLIYSVNDNLLKLFMLTKPEKWRSHRNRGGFYCLWSERNVLSVHTLSLSMNW